MITPLEIVRSGGFGYQFCKLYARGEDEICQAGGAWQA